MQYPKIIFTFLLTAGMVTGFGQTHVTTTRQQLADLAFTAGESQGSAAASYIHNWVIGKNKKWELGYGVRFTSYFGTKKDFITAPARLARSTTFPFAIVFAQQLEKNFDTLSVQRPFTNSLNFSANVGYRLSKKLTGGFNIDLIGFTFGRTSAAVLTSNGVTQTEAAAKPSHFNLLLTGDNDLGSLNSEFFLRYQLNQRWYLRAVYQFLFVEYKTASVKQTAPDGTEVYRFRNKANNFGLGVSYNF
jgi:hypothetical protein